MGSPSPGRSSNCPSSMASRMRFSATTWTARRDMRFWLMEDLCRIGTGKFLRLGGGIPVDSRHDSKARCARRAPPHSGSGPAARFRGGDRRRADPSSAIRLKAGGVIPRHHHDAPHLVVAVTDLSLRSEVEGQAATTRTLKTGEVAWIPGGITHTLTNVAPGEARLITLEFLGEGAR